MLTLLVNYAKYKSAAMLIYDNESIIIKKKYQDLRQTKKKTKIKIKKSLILKNYFANKTMFLFLKLLNKLIYFNIKFSFLLCALIKMNLYHFFEFFNVKI
jgi:hypothetical protein